MLFTMSVRHNALVKSHQQMQHCTEVVVEAVPRGVALCPIHTVEPGLLPFPYFSSVTMYVIHTKCGSWNRWSCIIPDSLTVGNPPRRCEVGIKVSLGGEDMGWDFPWGVFVSRVGSSRQGVVFFFLFFFLVVLFPEIIRAHLCDKTYKWESWMPACFDRSQAWTWTFSDPSFVPTVLEELWVLLRAYQCRCWAKIQAFFEWQWY